MCFGHSVPAVENAMANFCVWTDFYNFVFLELERAWSSSCWA